jgi:hypothetical protein
MIFDIFARIKARYSPPCFGGRNFLSGSSFNALKNTKKQEKA